MLRISKLADYATVIMNYLAARPEELASANEIAQRINLGTPTVSKVLKILCEASLVTSARGVEGGYRLARPAQSITLAEVVTAVDGIPALTECAQGAHSCIQEGVCAVKHNWRAINRFILETLQNLTLADMAQPLSFRAIRRELLFTVKDKTANAR